MTITIDLPPAVQAQAEQLAAAAGLDLDTWLRHLAEVASQWQTTPVDRSRALTFEHEGFPGIERHPAIMDGDARILRTRIPIWVLVGLRDDGMSDADLLANYTALTQADLNQAWGYARQHSEEIERVLRDQQEAE